MTRKFISKNQINRYPIYLNYLKSLNFSNEDFISNKQISNALNINLEVVKKDLVPATSVTTSTEGWIEVDGATAGTITMKFRDASLAKDLEYTITLPDTTDEDSTVTSAQFSGPTEVAK